MNWPTLKALNEIYEIGQTRKRTTLLKDPEVRFFLDSTHELMETRKAIIDPALNDSDGSGFRTTYERKHLGNFERYRAFFANTGIGGSHTRWEEKDIKILLNVHQRMESGELEELREQVIESNETVRGVSLMFFKDEKYLDRRGSLVDALKVLLDVAEFADNRDQQYIYKLECHNPKMIVLCENIYFLTMPTLPRKHGIELWFAGGRNVPKLKYAETRGLPIYYSCDWDRDGLEIYELVRDEFDSIKLLAPTGSPRSIEDTGHKSLWHFDYENNLSGLSPKLYLEKEQAFIRSLIQGNQWVVEESNDLMEMLRANVALT